MHDELTAEQQYWYDDLRKSVSNWVDNDRAKELILIEIDNLVESLKESEVAA